MRALVVADETAISRIAELNLALHVVVGHFHIQKYKIKGIFVPSARKV